ncbi:MAG: protein kinase domain-containing protein [Phycisphaerales bacterium]
MSRIDDPALRSAFGFDRAEEDWLSIVRSTSGGPGLGRLGPYELLAEAGHGAQGSVYKAVQPGTGRFVAIKRLGAGRFASPGMRARFEREVRSLATLSHPGVVTVFGTEEIEGQRALLMEWIDGVPIDAWARGRPVADALAVFVQVCDAVQHAHQRGVIHRDLKPSNILVDAGGKPRVLDFGLAKLLDDGSNGETPAHATRSSAFLGTPVYAAPEQIGGGGAGGGVDTRSDVYSLGVVLYQVLCDRLPFEPSGDLAALFETIRRGDPACPSSRTPRADAELDAIVLKAMAPEPESRYRSADALADDARRYLAGETVHAHPPRAAYRFRKLVRRHRAAAAAVAAALVLTLAFGVVVTTLAVNLNRERSDLKQSLAREHDALVQAEAARVEEARARRAADASAEEATKASVLAQQESRRHESAAQFLRRTIQAAGSAHESGPDVAEVLARAVADMDAGRLKDQPEVEVDLRRTIALSHRAMGRYREAEEQVRRSLALAEATAGPESVGAQGALNILGGVLEMQGRLAEAEQCHRRNLAIWERRYGVGHMNTIASLGNLANVLDNEGRFGEAESLYVRARDIVIRERGEASPHLAALYRDIALEQIEQERFAEAEPNIRRSLELFNAGGSSNPYAILRARRNLARVLLGTGRLDEGEALLRDVLDEWGTTYGRTHPEVAFETTRLAGVLALRGKTDEAVALFEESVRVIDVRVGPTHMWATQARIGLGRTLAGAAESARAESVLRDAAAHAAAGATGTERYVVEAAMTLGECLLAQGRTEDAARVAGEAIALLSERPPPGESLTAVCRAALDDLAARCIPPR